MEKLGRLRHSLQRTREDFFLLLFLVGQWKLFVYDCVDQGPHHALLRLVQTCNLQKEFKDSSIAMGIIG